MMDVEGINRDEIAIEDQRRHRIAFYSEADRGVRIGAPVNGCCQHRFRPHLLQIDILVALLPQSPSMDREERNGDEFGGWTPLFPPTCMNHAQIRKSIFAQAVACRGKYAHHVCCA